MFVYVCQGTARLTMSTGAPVGDKLNSLSIGPRGPLLLQDHVYLDEMSRFDRERIPERVVHAKGSGRCLQIVREFPNASCTRRVQVGAYRS